ncbi:hypothetical protein C8F04DRAFT_1061830 [Mycena alexandri]|uniref:Secreted protein n=1 Tax=Mycena alexandri TaxID=1745969 RepID=A0AAD6XG20_9AGAR|nr:hypothetical protein C8F04DRAFT_1061830 [Mycena alexandri]
MKRASLPLAYCLPLVPIFSCALYEDPRLITEICQINLQRIPMPPKLFTLRARKYPSDGRWQGQQNRRHSEEEKKPKDKPFDHYLGQECNTARVLGVAQCAYVPSTRNFIFGRQLRTAAHGLRNGFHDN